MLVQKNQVSRSKGKGSKPWTDRQTDKHTDRQTYQERTKDWRPMIFFQSLFLFVHRRSKNVIGLESLAGSGYVCSVCFFVVVCLSLSYAPFFDFLLYIVVTLMQYNGESESGWNVKPCIHLYSESKKNNFKFLLKMYTKRLSKNGQFLLQFYRVGGLLQLGNTLVF